MGGAVSEFGVAAVPEQSRPRVRRPSRRSPYLSTEHDIVLDTMITDKATYEVRCDRCQNSTAPNPATAFRSDWFIQAHNEPHSHICPDCLAFERVMKWKGPPARG